MKSNVHQEEPSVAGIPLSVQPDAQYFVSNSLFEKLIKLIDISDAGVFGVTGVRGAGKSVLLKKIAEHFEPTNSEASDRAYYTVEMSAPISASREMEFLLMLFRQVCDDVIRKLRTSIYGTRFDLSAIGTRQIVQSFWMVLLLAGFAIPIALPFLQEIFYAFLGKRTGEVLVPALVGLLSAGAIYVVVIASVWLFLKALHRILKIFRHRREFALLTLSEQLRDELEFEITRSRGAELKGPWFGQLTGILKMSEQRKKRPFTIPGLTAEYLSYLQRVRQVFPGKWLIIIDELDKVSDVEHVRSILREIKGALYSRGYFYLLSVSEDAVQAFDARFVQERDIFESTFDEIMPVDRLSLCACRDIINKRLGTALESIGKDEDVIAATSTIVAILSSGVPRELIRNLREVLLTSNVSGAEGAWQVLLTRKVRDIQERIKVAHGHDVARARMLKKLDEAIEFTHDGQQVIKLSIPDIDDEIERLRQEGTQTGGQETEQTNEAASSVFGGWMRLWLELKIHLLTGHVSFSERERLGERRDAKNRKLLSAYAILPYSVETCERYLEDLCELSNGEQ